MNTVKREEGLHEYIRRWRKRHGYCMRLYGRCKRRRGSYGYVFLLDAITARDCVRRAINALRELS